MLQRVGLLGNIRTIKIGTRKKIIKLELKFSKELPTDISELLRQHSYWLSIEQHLKKGGSFYAENTRWFTINMMVQDKTEMVQLLKLLDHLEFEIYSYKVDHEHHSAQQKVEPQAEIIKPEVAMAGKEQLDEMEAELSFRKERYSHSTKGTSIQTYRVQDKEWRVLGSQCSMCGNSNNVLLAELNHRCIALCNQCFMYQSAGKGEQVQVFGSLDQVPWVSSIPTTLADPHLLESLHE